MSHELGQDKVNAAELQCGRLEARVIRSEVYTMCCSACCSVCCSVCCSADLRRALFAVRYTLCVAVRVAVRVAVCVAVQTRGARYSQ